MDDIAGHLEPNEPFARVSPALRDAILAAAADFGHGRPRVDALAVVVAGAREEGT